MHAHAELGWETTGRLGQVRRDPKCAISLRCMTQETFEKFRETQRPAFTPQTCRRAQRPWWCGNVASRGCCRHSVACCSWSGLRPSPPHSAGSATCSPGKRRRVRWRRTSPSAPTLLILVRRSARSGRMQASGASSLPSAPRVVDRPDSEPAQPGSCRARLRQPGQRAVALDHPLTVARRPLQVSASPTMGG